MAFFNPMRLFIIPFLSLVTLPLAIFAGITTILAFSVLLFRVSLVYIDLLASLLPSYIFSRDSSHTHQLRRTPHPPATTAPTTPGEPALSVSARPLWGRRTSSVASAADLATPLSECALGVAPSAGLDRDFEGIGGWRTAADDDDDELWTSMNPRPDEPRWQHRGKGHHRALTWGPTTAEVEEGIVSRARTRSPRERRSGISPNSTRIRSPPTASSASGSSTGPSRPSLSARITR